MKKFLKKGVYLLGGIILLASDVIYAQCPASYTSAAINWDFHYFRVNPPTGTSFAIGTTSATLAYTPTLNGINATNTGEAGSFGAGADIQFTGNGTVTLTFKTEVQNVKFSLYDIDLSQVATIAATNAASVAQTVTLAKISGATLTVVSGTPASATATAAGLANTSTDATANVSIAGPVKTVTITLSGTAGDFWLSDIAACVNGDFPTAYQAVSTPEAGQPEYLAAAYDNKIYAINNSTKAATLVYTDAAFATNGINGFGYDPYKQIFYYTDNTSAATNKSVYKYDLKTCTKSTFIADVTTLGIQLETAGMGSGGGTFFGGSYYLGVDVNPGNNNEAASIWRIDIDAAGNAISPASRVWGVQGTNGSGTDLYNWADFVINNGVIYNFNAGSAPAANTSVQHLSLNNQTVLNGYTVSPSPSQAGIGYDGSIYQISATGVQLYNGSGAFAAATAITGVSGALKDAAETFKFTGEYGDAPAGYGTAWSNAVANCTAPTLRIGASIDYEVNDINNVNADGDDGSNTGAADDEDGVATIPTLPVAATTYSLTVSVFNNTGSAKTLQGWLDYNRNGLFDNGEYATVNVPTNAAQQNVTLAWSGISGIVAGLSYVRLRLNDNATKTNTDDIGLFGIGEVEDYPVNIVATITGTVFNDPDAGNVNNSTGATNVIPSGMFAILVDNSNKIVASVAIGTDGTYTIPNVLVGTYTVQLSATDLTGSIGSTAPATATITSGWSKTGEFNGAPNTGTDATVDSKSASFIVTASVTNINFGIEQLPTPSTISATSQTNPGGTANVTVPATTFGATDASSGTISSIRISAFPTNATSITINGTTYTSGTFPGGGVSVPTNTSGQPTQAITIDPIDGAVTSVITYYATDNAGKESSVTGTASMPFTTVIVSGNVYNDVNGLTNSLVDGSGTNAGGLNAILVDNSGDVAATAVVAAGGTYSFPSVNGGTYTVLITTATGTIGAAAPAVTLPTGWVSTGEGTTAAGDGTANGVTNTFTVTNANVTGVNFGIEQTATPSTLSATSQTNPGGTANVTVPATTFGATDASSGTISSIRISAFPTNATSITINGTTYTSGTFPGGGVSVPTNTSGQPTQAITIDPIDGAVTSVITYYATDNAGKESSVTGTASMPFTTVIVSGNVYNDVNGLTNSLVDGSGTNAGGLNAILVDNSGNVAATAVVAAGGTYSFPSVNGGTYTVLITTATGTIGAAAPAVTLPSGWVSTGEGTTPAGDGTANGTTNTFTVTNANVTGVNFGIEQTATPSTISATSQTNPGGTTAVTVPDTTFGATDASSGTISSIRISAFPTNATSITINGTTYTSGTFPGGGVSVPTNTSGQPTQAITIDPIDGAVTSVITYYATDNAGKESSTTGTASMPFTTLSLSGIVFNDLNHNISSSGTPDAGEPGANGSNSGSGLKLGSPLYINLIDAAGIVIGSSAVQTDGTYFLMSVPANASGLILQLSSRVGVLGAAKPSTILPLAWTNSGENKNGQAGAADAVANGEIAITTTTANITTQNFGVKLKDSDRDGIPDIDDIDDDNDGIPDLVEIGYDPLADADNDNIPNYLDTTPGSGMPTFTDVNGDGINDFYDTELDGLMDNVDLDTDNDGIADLVEAGGIDTNGDGTIDNLTDTDGDGLMDAYDVTNGGVNIANLDTDGDGVPNYRDLDSDNDGIPDVVEAGGTDANNDGRIDGFTDTDNDGFADNVDGDVGNDGTAENISNVLIITSAVGSTSGRPASYPRANAERTGMPNPYDLDSDGDGITDATESGLSVSYNGGMVSGCVLVNGWCSTISAQPTLGLVNTDGSGAPDVYDIDSDNDGITDNIEAQPTGSYVVPTDADTDGDGIADVYDFTNGMGGNGITAYDHDFDGIPDYMDTDSDNDGAPDRNEADKTNASLSQATINASGDADGDGLMDLFDSYNLSIEAGNFYANVANGNMGASGSYNGPAISGSNVSLVKSVAAASNRDWRNVGLLALHILTFNGERGNGVSKLMWNASNDQEINFYVLERSYDGRTFDSVGVVISTRGIFTSYKYKDESAANNNAVIYYRIKQITKTGTIDYSKVISLKENSNAIFFVKLWPNPVENVLNLNIALPTKSAITVSITDVTGKTFINKSFEAQKGDNMLSLFQLGKLHTGMYLIKVCTIDGCYSETLFKK